MFGTEIIYSTAQVAKILDISSSTLKSWCEALEGIIDVKIVNANRQFNDNSLEQLKLIRKLIKEDGLTIVQVKKYIVENGFNVASGLINSNNPLPIQVFTSSVVVALNNQLTKIEENMLSRQELVLRDLVKKIDENNESVREKIISQIEGTNTILRNEINSMVSESLSKQGELISKGISSLEAEINATRADNEKIDRLYNLMQERKEEAQKNKQGFFYRLFHFFR